MSSKGEEKRQRIIDAANALFYHKGFATTSFADIAGAADIPKGNFYFYFRTKEDLLQAVVDDRLARLKALMDEWRETISDPRQRLHRLADIPIKDKVQIVRYGCPMGSLSAELGKDNTVESNFVIAMFDLILAEAESALLALNHPKADAKRLARSLLIRLQGAANMAHAYQDERWIVDENRAIHDWIEAL